MESYPEPTGYGANQSAARGYNIAFPQPSAPHQPLTPHVEQIEAQAATLVDRLQTIEGRLFGYKAEAQNAQLSAVPPQGIVPAMERVAASLLRANQIASVIADRI